MTLQIREQRYKIENIQLWKFLPLPSGVLKICTSIKYILGFLHISDHLEHKKSAEIGNRPLNPCPLAVVRKSTQVTFLPFPSLPIPKC